MLHSTICKLFDKKRGCFAPHFYGLSLICAESSGILYYGALYLNASQLGSFSAYCFERAALSSGVWLLRRKKTTHCRGLRRNLGNCGALARKTVHFRGLPRTFGNCDALAYSVQLWRCHRCATHTIEGSAGHVTSRFQVRLRRVCCALFDSYRR